MHRFLLIFIYMSIFNYFDYSFGEEINTLNSFMKGGGTDNEICLAKEDYMKELMSSHSTMSVHKDKEDTYPSSSTNQPQYNSKSYFLITNKENKNKNESFVITGLNSTCVEKKCKADYFLFMNKKCQFKIKKMKSRRSKRRISLESYRHPYLRKDKNLNHTLTLEEIVRLRNRGKVLPAGTPRLLGINLHISDMIIKKVAELANSVEINVIKNGTVYQLTTPKIIAYWSTWKEWSSCCNASTKTRTRTCIPENGTCPGINTLLSQYCSLDEMNCIDRYSTTTEFVTTTTTSPPTTTTEIEITESTEGPQSTIKYRYEHYTCQAAECKLYPIERNVECFENDGPWKKCGREKRRCMSRNRTCLTEDHPIIEVPLGNFLEIKSPIKELELHGDNWKLEHYWITPNNINASENYEYYITDTKRNKETLSLTIYNVAEKDNGFYYAVTRNEKFKDIFRIVEIKVMVCGLLPNFCRNGGRCYHRVRFNITSLACDCKGKYTGFKCQLVSGDIFGNIIGWVVTGIIVIIIVASVILLYAKHGKKKVKPEDMEKLASTSGISSVSESTFGSYFNTPQPSILKAPIKSKAAILKLSMKEGNKSNLDDKLKLKDKPKKAKFTSKLRSDKTDTSMSTYNLAVKDRDADGKFIFNLKTMGIQTDTDILSITDLSSDVDTLSIGLSDISTVPSNSSIDSTALVINKNFAKKAKQLERKNIRDISVGRDGKLVKHKKGKSDNFTAKEQFKNTMKAFDDIEQYTRPYLSTTTIYSTTDFDHTALSDMYKVDKLKRSYTSTLPTMKNMNFKKKRVFKNNLDFTKKMNSKALSGTISGTSLTGKHSKISGTISGTSLTSKQSKISGTISGTSLTSKQSKFSSTISGTSLTGKESKISGTISGTSLTSKQSKFSGTLSGTSLASKQSSSLSGTIISVKSKTTNSKTDLGSMSGRSLGRKYSRQFDKTINFGARYKKKFAVSKSSINIADRFKTQLSKSDSRINIRDKQNDDSAKKNRKYSSTFPDMKMNSFSSSSINIENKKNSKITEKAKVDTKSKDASKSKVGSKSKITEKSTLPDKKTKKNAGTSNVGNKQLAKDTSKSKIASKKAIIPPTNIQSKDKVNPQKTKSNKNNANIAYGYQWKPKTETDKFLEDLIDNESALHSSFSFSSIV